MSAACRPFLRFLVLGLVVAVGGGCVSYPQRTAKALRAFEEGRFDAAMSTFGDADSVGSRFLRGAETGTVAWTAGDWDRSIAAFGEAVDEVRDLEDRGMLGPDKLAESLGSWVLNDTTRSYQGEGFERVYTHVYLALAYLAKGMLDDVYVEARRANELLESEEKLYEKSYGAGGVGHFVSALAYELLGEPAEAYIDYARMAEKEVGLGLAGPSLVRLAREQGRSEDIDRWLERFGEPAERPPESASVVLIAGVGLAPYKVEGSLVVPTPDGLIPFAVPTFHERPQLVSELVLREHQSGTEVATELLENVQRIAIENLGDRVGWMAAKSVARGVLKRELTKQLEESQGLAGRIAGDLFAAISERADLRFWSTLPASFQAARLHVPAGTVDLSLDALGGESRSLGRYALEPGETLIVLARNLGPRLYTHVVGGHPLVDPDAVESAPAAPPVELQP